ncbi:OmpA family protein [Vibrio sp. 99-8-1]|uniref:OmpA family protein n=1 Tax=Vibrio sp. 99-8-1 TaxID=2607602 RepID=UPI0014932CE7|nr:OmpA family protein [Vibrio sp. 99-8-1]NOI68759.1 OmpA family protein [Vibrio sp. 99-8-1]
MSNRKGTDTEEHTQMKHIRHLLLGDNNKLVRDTMEENARDIVSNVLTEALHDRQKSDGTVSKVLTPLVEKSVEASVVARKEQFVSYLYPLVGSLVRKSVSAFLSEIVEQTNALLESSLTYKGLKWRVKAWQAGVSYSQYVVSQTFLFRVEQVLLIHQDTGLLLNTVVKDKTQTTDADMVSAMLTAINDFVSDSFSQQDDSSEQSLDEIKTDDFTLLIKRGPRAILVAAVSVSGTVPSHLGEQLQLTLEDIHRIYGDELETYDGNSAPFDNTEQQLTDCLLSQQKQQEDVVKKRPWLALVLLFGLFSFIGYYLYERWQLDYYAWQVSQLPPAAGIVLLNAERCENEICVDVLRDPIAQPVTSWIGETASVDVPWQINEQPFQSLEPELLQRRINAILNDFPELTYESSNTQLVGELSPQRYRLIQKRIDRLPDSPEMAKILQQVTVSQHSINGGLLDQFLFDQLITTIEGVSIHFENDQSSLNEQGVRALESLSGTVISVTEMSSKLKQSIQIVIMGISDPLGTKGYNQILSKKRADVVRDKLIEQGVDPNIVRSVGLGILDSSYGARRVAFGVIKFLPESSERVQN